MLGIAGGFSPENVKESCLLREKLKTKEFCIDAKNKRTGEHLDLEKVEKYLNEAVEAFNSDYPNKSSQKNTKMRYYCSNIRNFS
jgi:hypothetical protein